MHVPVRDTRPLTLDNHSSLQTTMFKVRGFVIISNEKISFKWKARGALPTTNSSPTGKWPKPKKDSYYFSQAPFFRGELLNFGCSFYFNLKITFWLSLVIHPILPSPPNLQRMVDLPNQHVSVVSHWRRHQMTSCKVEESASGSELVVSEYRKLKKNMTGPWKWWVFPLENSPLFRDPFSGAMFVWRGCISVLMKSSNLTILSI